VIAFLLMLALGWLPLAVPIHLLLKDSNQASIVTLVILYAEFIWLVRFWGKQVYQQPNLLWWYGLEFSDRSGRELLAGLALGCSSLLLLFGTQGILGWLVWQPASMDIRRLMAEGLLVALGVGFAEELLFRGWLLNELQRDYSASVSLWVDAGIFALVHRINQFPALVLLGATLIWAKRSRTELTSQGRRDRLALPMGIHAGLVWGYYMVNVGNLVTYTDQVPTWVTGIDHNPLIGVMGLLFLSLLAFGMKQFAKVSQATAKN
jgi:membrane protease YdiL (CAAX protease family)